MADEPEPTSATVSTSAAAGAVPPQDMLDQLRDALEQSRASKEIIEALGREGDSSGRILDTIVERSTRLCRADAGQLYLLEGDVFRQTRTWGISAEFREYIRGHPVQLSRSSLLGRVALDRRTQQIADVMNDPEYGRRDLAQVGGFRTSARRRRWYSVTRSSGPSPSSARAVAPFSDREIGDARRRSRRRLPWRFAGGPDGVAGAAEHRARQQGGAARGAGRARGGGELEPGPRRGARAHRHAAPSG